VSGDSLHSRERRYVIGVFSLFSSSGNCEEVIFYPWPQSSDTPKPPPPHRRRRHGVLSREQGDFFHDAPPRIPAFKDYTTRRLPFFPRTAASCLSPPFGHLHHHRAVFGGRRSTGSGPGVQLRLFFSPTLRNAAPPVGCIHRHLVRAAFSPRGLDGGSTANEPGPDEKFARVPPPFFRAPPDSSLHGNPFFPVGACQYAVSVLTVPSSPLSFPLPIPARTEGGVVLLSCGSHRGRLLRLDDPSIKRSSADGRFFIGGRISPSRSFTPIVFFFLSQAIKAGDCSPLFLLPSFFFLFLMACESVPFEPYRYCPCLRWRARPGMIAISFFVDALAFIELSPVSFDSNGFRRLNTTPPPSLPWKDAIPAAGRSFALAVFH